MFQELLYRLKIRAKERISKNPWYCSYIPVNIEDLNSNFTIRLHIHVYKYHT